MINAFKHLIHSETAVTAVGAILAAAAMGAAPTVAKADRGGWDRHDNHGRYEWHDRDDHRGGGRFDLHFGGPVYEPAPVVIAPQPVWVEPVYSTVTDRVWVGPQYRTVIDHVWVEPVTQSVSDRVWVPDRFDWRDLQHVDASGKAYVTREKALVEPGHFQEQTRQVVVTPGHYEDVPRQELVADGHFEDVTRQELVCAGHYENGPMFVAPAPRYHSGIGIGVRIPLGR